MRHAVLVGQRKLTSPKQKRHDVGFVEVIVSLGLVNDTIRLHLDLPYCAHALCGPASTAWFIVSTPAPPLFAIPLWAIEDRSSPISCGHSYPPRFPCPPCASCAATRHISPRCHPPLSRPFLSSPVASVEAQSNAAIASRSTAIEAPPIHRGLSSRLRTIARLSHPLQPFHFDRFGTKRILCGQSIHLDDLCLPADSNAASPFSSPIHAPPSISSAAFPLASIVIESSPLLRRQSVAFTLESPPVVSNAAVPLPSRRLLASRLLRSPSCPLLGIPLDPNPTPPLNFPSSPRQRERLPCCRSAPAR